MIGTPNFDDVDLAIVFIGILAAVAYAFGHAPEGLAGMAIAAIAGLARGGKKPGG